jgi:glutaredoxin
MHVEIYTKPNCTYCVEAKKQLNVRNIQYKEHLLDRDFTKQMLSEKFNTAKTYPVVVVDGFYIGGYNELTAKLYEMDLQATYLTE